MDAQQHLNTFNNYFCLYNREIDKDLRETKEIKDEKEKSKKVSSLLEKHKVYESNIIYHYTTGKLYEKSGCATKKDEYCGKINQLKKFSKDTKKKETEPESNQKKSHNSNIPANPIPKKTTTSSEENQPEEDFFCEQCFKKIEAGKKFFYKKGKKNEKLCSQDCFLSYHGELCHKCCNHFLTVYQHWDKKGFPDVVYCSNCYDLAKKEWQEEEERWDKLTNRECRYCQAKTNSIFDVCEKQTCLDKMNEEIDKRRNNDPLPNNNDQQQDQQRERERAITTRH